MHSKRFVSISNNDCVTCLEWLNKLEQRLSFYVSVSIKRMCILNITTYAVLVYTLQAPEQLTDTTAFNVSVNVVADIRK